eukprot:m.161451 g.161451  ORF g.161451 m.161451 type:complete len:79 (+) comp14363_c0_seq1:3749-3985(+)
MSSKKNKGNDTSVQLLLPPLDAAPQTLQKQHPSALVSKEGKKIMKKRKKKKITIIINLVSMRIKPNMQHITTTGNTKY